MISFTDYESYFDGLARDFRPISHTDQAPRFALMDIDDILSSQRTGLDFTQPCMILENFEGEFEYKHNKIKEESLGAFYIIQNVSRDNPVQKREVMDRCKDLGTRIISKMQIQRIRMFEGIATAPRMVLYFNLNDVKYQKVSNIFSGCHGWRFEFNLGSEYQIPFDTDDWYSESEP